MPKKVEGKVLSVKLRNLKKGDVIPLNVANSDFKQIVLVFVGSVYLCVNNVLCCFLYN